LKGDTLFIPLEVKIYRVIQISRTILKEVVEDMI
jgi:hypothetical protein